MATNKVIIALPCSGTITAECTYSLLNMVNGLDYVQPVIHMSCDLAGSRTWLVKKARELGGTHILFVDDDMCFPADTLTKLLTHDKDIVGVEYNYRKLPLTNVAVPLGDRSDEPYKCVSIGTGMALIKLPVFEKLPEPWFAFEKGESDDMYFCRNAMYAGYEVWCDPTIGVKHVGTYLF